MTKSIFLLLSLLYVIIINSGNALAQKKVEKQIIFEYVDPLRKVFPETSYFPSEKAAANVARGEHASFQFVLRSGLPMENVSVTVEAPVNGNEKLGIIKTGFVGFVPVDRPTPRPGRDYLKSVSGQVMSQSYKQWPVLHRFNGENLRKVAMPIGGIGTGTVSIGGRGNLMDWEIMSQGALVFIPKFNIHYAATAVAPFFAIRTKHPDGEIQARLLEGPLNTPNIDGDWGCNELNGSFPRFAKSLFEGAYPLAQVRLWDSKMPIKVNIKAFNPLVPGDTPNSSLPVAILKFEVQNSTDETLEITICGVVPNYIGTDGWGGDVRNTINSFRKEPGFSGIFMASQREDTLTGKWGTMALTTTSKQDVSYRTQWKGDMWWNGSVIDFWDDLRDDGIVEERHGEYSGNKPATLAVKFDLVAGEQKDVTFLLSWDFPYRIGWEAQPGVNHPVIKNFYSNRFSNAWDVASEVVSGLNALEENTVEFVRAFVNGDTPYEIKEASLSNIANLRSQTVFRDEDGYTYGWEGTGSIYGTNINPKGARAGWGFGSCTHVWNYEVTTPFLFGDLAMSMREVEFKYATDSKTGKIAHRVYLPVKTFPQDHGPAADGQLGCIMKMYRDWQLSGDNEKLEELYPQIKAAMEFVWKSSGWDKDTNGVLDGSHHNTMDVNYEGPNPQMGTWYLGALRATEEMAKQMKDRKFASQCRAMFEYGSNWIDSNLFNGEYYIQKLPRVIDFQVGEGILVDQLIGQYMAHICDLGYLLSPENMKTTLQTIKRKNFKKGFYDHLSTFRSFAIGDEAGLLMAYYPKGKREARPFPYFSEVMTGFEYSTAAHMIYEGLENEGLEVIRAIRNRYNGTNRNPYNEGEFGHRYGRAMASWSGLLAYTGFFYSGVTNTIRFKAQKGNYFWSNGYAYGTVDISENNNKFEAILHVLGGEIKIDKFVFKGANVVELKKAVMIHGGDQYKFE